MRVSGVEYFRRDKGLYSNRCNFRPKTDHDLEQLTNRRSEMYYFDHFWPCEYVCMGLAELRPQQVPMIDFG